MKLPFSRGWSRGLSWRHSLSLNERTTIVRPENENTEECVISKQISYIENVLTIVFFEISNLVND